MIVGDGSVGLPKTHLTTRSVRSICISVIDTYIRARAWYPFQLLLFALTPPVALWFVVMGSVPMETLTALVALAVVVVPVSLVALGSSEAAAKKWAFDRGAEFTAPWVSRLRRHLARTRVARTLGFTLGIAAPMMLMSRYNADPDTFSWYLDNGMDHLQGLWLPGLGYVTGSVWAEATKPRPDGGDGSGTALLTPRRLGDYLDPDVRRIAAVFAGIAAATTAFWFVAPTVQDQLGKGSPWTALAGPLLVAALALSAAWWTCRRQERTSDDAALAYEELTRTATVNALVGVVIAMLAEYTSLLTGVPRNGVLLPLWIQFPFGAFALLGLVIWAACGTRLVFRNRRMDILTGAA